MKRLMIWTSAISLAAVTGVAAFALAGGTQSLGWCLRGGHSFGPLGLMTRELNLSDNQISQIKTIWQAERPAAAELVREFAAEAKEMDAATAQQNPDVGKIQEIAGRQGATVTKALLEKERLRSQIYGTVLTAEQRTKADTLASRWHARLDSVADRIERGGEAPGK